MAQTDSGYTKTLGYKPSIVLVLFYPKTSNGTYYTLTMYYIGSISTTQYAGCYARMDGTGSLGHKAVNLNSEFAGGYLLNVTNTGWYIKTNGVNSYNFFYNAYIVSIK